MEKFTPIRITKKDRQEYQKLVRNTKSKIRRTRKKYGIDLSGEIKLPDISDFKTRDEYNYWKSKQKDFTNRGNMKYQFVKNKYGVVASKSEIFKTEMATKIARHKAKEIQDKMSSKPFISGGKQQGTVGQRMKQMAKPSVGGVSVPPEFDFDTIRNKQHLDRKRQSMESKAQPEYFDERKATMKTNFMDILLLSFNSDANKLVNELNQINPDDFFEIYLMFDEFDFDLYDSEGQVVNADENTINQMLSYIEQYKKGEVNMDLKDF